jgi:hypothetical protein
MEPNRPERPRRERRALARKEKKASGGAKSSGKAIGAGIAGIAALAGAAATPAADAATFTVTTFLDSGPGSLRQAILDANGAPGADIVDFQVGLMGTITLTSGQIAITDSVTIQGPGAPNITVSGNTNSRVFYLYNGASLLDVTMSGITITSGSDAFGAGIIDFDENLTLDDVTMRFNAATVDGGAIWANGLNLTIEIRNSRITGNTAGDDGGGIYINNVAAMTIENSTIANNTAGGRGGGAYFYIPTDLLTIDTTTISGNTATGPGGGLGFFYSSAGASFVDSTLSGNAGSDGGGVFFYLPVEPLTVENCTISGNQATTGEGGGIYLYTLYAGTSELRHTTVAGNSAPASVGGGVILVNGSVPMDHMIVGDNTAAADPDLSGGTFDLSWSLVEAPGGAVINNITGNVLNQDPQLGALGNNGGPTETHLPAAASPAVNAGDPAFAPPPATDQRGFPRVADGRIDMGSVELVQLFPGTIQLTMTAVSVAENVGTVTITATRTGGTDGAVSVTITSADGSAIAPGDYGAIPGGTMLSWADGDGAPKSINVSIVDDPDPEPDETFSVSISNPTGGAALGSPTTEQVTILEDPADTVSVVEIPTLGDFGKVLFAALTAAAGFLLMRRKKGLAAPVLVVSLALGASPADAARKAPQEVRATTVAQLTTQGNTVTIRLADGTVYQVSKDKFQLVEGRKGQRGRAPGPVAANQPVVLKMRRAADGSVRRMKVVVVESAAAAQAQAAQAQAAQGKPKADE